MEKDKNIYDDDKTIDMLLDVDHYYGEHEGSMGNKIIYLLVAGIPLVLYIYFGLFYVIPTAVFIPIWFVYAIRMALLIIGDESTRLKYFRKMIHDVFSSLYDILRITRVHEDGLIEYLGGTVTYLVVAYNGNDEDRMRHAATMAKFIESCAGDRDYDIYIQNIVETQSLRERYKNVKLFGDIQAAQDFVDIIDYNSQMVEENSTLQKIVFAFKGSKSDWKEMKMSIDGAIHSKSSKCFKTVYRVTDKDECEEIMSRDLDGIISISEIMRKKYCTNNYFGSKVLCYDDNKTQTKSNTHRPVRQKETNKTNTGNFHVMFKGE